MKRFFFLITLALLACTPKEVPTPEEAPDYGIFNKPGGWTLVGTIEDSAWAKDFEMYTDGTWHVIMGVKVTSSDEFKFRRGRSWDYNLGAGTAGSKTAVSPGEKVYLTTGGGNIKLPEGKYDLYIAPDTQVAYFLPRGAEFTHHAEGIMEIGGDLYGDYSAALPSAQKLSGITYQVNVYSFADSDGDGWGDFQGIIDHLDYLDAIGATALWLSPVNAQQSYHGYDIKDYYSIEPRLGGKNATAQQAEEKLAQLIQKAGEKNIDIYLDYVLNHSGDQHPWFKAAKNGDAQYSSYYVMADATSGPVDNFAGRSHPGMGAWHQYGSYSGRLKFTVTWDGQKYYDHMTVLAEETTDEVQSSNPNAKIWIFTGSGTNYGMYPVEGKSNTYEITLNVNTGFGFLVRTSTSSWADGDKWGGDGTQFRLGQVFKPTPEKAQDIRLGKSYFGSFDGSMPDLSYGPWESCQESASFKDLAESADKWINLGVNGLRLDAVMWIYQCQTAANVKFLSEWYKHCNATYKARGGEGDIFMVGEAFDYEANNVAPYFKGLPSLFDFPFYGTLKDRIGRAQGSDLGSTIKVIQDKYKAQNAQAQPAIKLSNHDEDRVASALGNHNQKLRLAAAVLLTSPGKPFIYQGEELGYWGTKKSGDENVRQPINWFRSGSVPTGWHSFSKDVIKADMSVEAQAADNRSLLQLYRHFAYARNTHPALAEGYIQTTSSGDNAVAAWYMKSTDETVLVMHNMGAAPVTVTRQEDKLDHVIVSNHKVEVSGNEVTLPPYSSVVFQQ